MRKQLKILDEDSLPRFKSVHAMMIEEVQTMVNRMEASLEDQRDVRKLTDKRSKLRREVRELKREKEELEELESKSGDIDEAANSISEILRNSIEDV